MKISMDFDGTLSTIKGKSLAKRLIDQGNELYIITARMTAESAPVYKVAKDLGIPESRVIFTNHSDKWRFMSKYGIKKHYDNNTEQIDKINNQTLTEGIKFSEEMEFRIEKHKGENKSEFISRCIAIEMKNGHPQDQSIAICSSKWMEFSEQEKINNTLQYIKKYNDKI